MSTPFSANQRAVAGVACGLSLVLAAALAHAGDAPAPRADPMQFQAAAPAGGDAHRQTLQQIVAHALANNPEIRAARNEREAATQRIAPAGALEDPMLEAGLLNLPTRSFSFSREDMTMKMLGLSQRFPYPGKRALKREVAAKDADSVGHAYQETVNRVARDTKVAYYDLALSIESTRLVQQNRSILQQLLKVVEGRYSVGQGSQVDVLRAQTQLSKLTEELIRLARERPMFEAELNRLLGRPASTSVPPPSPLQLEEIALSDDLLYEQALASRPQLLALRNIVTRNERAVELATRDRFPDFDVKFSYAQRDNMPDGTRRSDMVNLTVAVNLPVWRQTKIGPRVAEAQALREQALALYEAQRNETAMRLRQQIVAAQQSVHAARLYRTEIVPQSRLTVEAALAAYQVNRLEFAPLLDNQMAIFSFEIARVAALASYNKALAEIDLLTGRPPPENPGALDDRMKP